MAGKSSADNIQREAGSVGTRDTVPRGGDSALERGRRSRLEEKKRQGGWAMPDLENSEQ